MAVLVIGFSFFVIVPEKHIGVIQVEVLALEDVVGGQGLRRIKVRMPDGKIVWIETLVPFFYKEGYSANLAVSRSFFGEETYDFVAN